MSSTSSTAAPVTINSKKFKHSIQSLLNDEDESLSAVSPTQLEEQIASAKALLSLGNFKEQEKQIEMPQRKDSVQPTNNSVPSYSFSYPSQYYHAPMAMHPSEMLPHPTAPSMYYPTPIPYGYQSAHPMLSIPSPSYTIPPRSIEQQQRLMGTYGPYYPMPPSAFAIPVSNNNIATQIIPAQAKTTPVTRIESPESTANVTNSSGVSVINISDDEVAKSYKVKEVDSKYVKGKVYVVDPKSKKKDIAPNTALFHITQSLLKEKFKVDASSNIKLVSKKGGKIHVVHDCKQNNENN